MINAFFTGEKIASSSEEAFSLFEKSCFGEKKNGKIEYATFEALLLTEIKKLKIYQNKKELSFEDLLNKLKKKDKKLETRYSVYRDLRKKGYIVKTALKFGAEFRVYEKGIKPGVAHAKWILFISNEQDMLKWHDFAAKNRVAHSTKKNLLIAILDEEGDISYYECTWLKP